jgi:hypothetical protein
MTTLNVVVACKKLPVLEHGARTEGKDVGGTVNQVQFMENYIYAVQNAVLAYG